MATEKTLQLAYGSVLVGALVIALKFAAFWLTGSVALFSDALESFVNLASALAALLAIRVSLMPADADHPYGHSKAEYFSAVITGVLVVLAAVAILREAYLAFLQPEPLDAPWTGLLINGVAAAINALWAFVLVRQGRNRRAPALIADGRHLHSDVLTSLGVIVGVAAVALTGWLWLDPAIAAAVALSILWTGWGIMRDSVGGLMDEAVPSGELDRIRDIISATGTGALEAHDLRTRHAGRTTFIDFHLVVPGDLSVSAAHDICDEVERALRSEIDGAVVTVHVEPENKAKHSGIVVL